MAPIKHYLNQSICKRHMRQCQSRMGWWPWPFEKHRWPPNFYSMALFPPVISMHFPFLSFFKVPSAQIGFINVMCQITKVNVVLGVKIVVVFITEPWYFQSFSNNTSIYKAFSRQALLFTSGSREAIKTLKLCIQAALLQTSQWRGPRHRCISCVQACLTYYRFFFVPYIPYKTHNDTAIEHAR